MTDPRGMVAAPGEITRKQANAVHGVADFP